MSLLLCARACLRIYLAFTSHIPWNCVRIVSKPRKVVSHTETVANNCWNGQAAAAGGLAAGCGSLGADGGQVCLRQMYSTYTVFVWRYCTFDIALSGVLARAEGRGLYDRVVVGDIVTVGFWHTGDKSRLYAVFKNKPY